MFRPHSSVRYTPRIVMIVAALLVFAMITSNDVLATPPPPCTGGWHYHDGVGIDCGASLGVGSSTWSGAAITLSAQNIEEISLSAAGTQWCWYAVVEWETGWKTNENDHIIGSVGSAGLLDPCGDGSYLQSFGAHLWSTAHLHSSKHNIDHPNEMQ